MTWWDPFSRVRSRPRYRVAQFQLSRHLRLSWLTDQKVSTLLCKYKIHHTSCSHFSTKTTYACPGVYIRGPSGVNLPILVPARLLPRPSRSMYFGDVSETRSDHVTGNASAVNFLPIYAKVPWTDASITEKCSLMCWNTLNPSNTFSLSYLFCTENFPNFAFHATPWILAAWNAMAVDQFVPKPVKKTDKGDEKDDGDEDISEKTPEKPEDKTSE